VLKAPVAYPLPRGDRELVDFINVWLDLKKRDRTIETLYDYWILGKNAVPKQPRFTNSEREPTLSDKSHS